MPIHDLGSTIAIIHPIVGFGPDADEISKTGGMTIEMALWLQGRQMIVEGAPESITTSTLKGHEQHEMVSRCKSAAIRGYRPPLFTNYNEFTLTGIERAKVASYLITEMDRQVTNLPYDFAQWTSLDYYFIRADLQVRALKMLKMVDKAIIDAQARVADENMRMMVKMQEAVDETRRLEIQHELEAYKSSLILKIEPIQTNIRKIPIGQIADLSQIEADLREPDANLALVYLNVTDSKQQPYALTGTLRQRGKADLQHLIRLGLVNLAAYHAGKTGRPKHIVWPSPLGLKVIRDLEKRGII